MKDNQPNFMHCVKQDGTSVRAFSIGEGYYTMVFIRDGHETSCARCPCPWICMQYAECVKNMGLFAVTEAYRTDPDAAP